MLHSVNWNTYGLMGKCLYYYLSITGPNVLAGFFFSFLCQFGNTKSKTGVFGNVSQKRFPFNQVENCPLLKNIGHF